MIIFSCILCKHVLQLDIRLFGDGRSNYIWVLGMNFFVLFIWKHCFFLFKYLRIFLRFKTFCILSWHIKYDLYKMNISKGCFIYKKCQNLGISFKWDSRALCGQVERWGRVEMYKLPFAIANLHLTLNITGISWKRYL